MQCKQPQLCMWRIRIAVRERLTRFHHICIWGFITLDTFDGVSISKCFSYTIAFSSFFQKHWNIKKMLESSYCVCVKHNNWNDTKRPDIIKFSYSSSTIILLTKYFTTYWCIQVAHKIAFHLWSKKQLSSCFATGQQFSVIYAGM